LRSVPMTLARSTPSAELRRLVLPPVWFLNLHDWACAEVHRKTVAKTVVANVFKCFSPPDRPDFRPKGRTHEKSGDSRLKPNNHWGSPPDGECALPPKA
jgi:hypothetical protein